MIFVSNRHSRLNLLLIRSSLFSVSMRLKAKRLPRFCRRDIPWHALLVLDGVARRREDNVQLLQRALPRLHEEEVDDRDEARVEDRVDDVCLPGDVREGRRDRHHHHEAEDPVGCRGDAVDLRPAPQRRDLRRVQKRPAHPYEAEERVVEEQ